ncbi:MAG: GNAT family N-acetyltransferase [Rhodoglobus sp.]
MRSGRLDSDLYRVTAYVDSSHDDGEVVEVAEPDSLADVPQLWHTDASDHGMIGITIADSATPGAPALWFVNVDEPKSSPRATNLVAFPTDHFPPGTVVDRYAFGPLGLDNDRQAGAIRWYRETGVIHQIFVAEAWRRKQVGTVLLYAASAFHQANGWAGRLQADGRRTELGERLATSLKHRARVAPLSETMPPMDPPSQVPPPRVAT